MDGGTTWVNFKSGASYLGTNISIEAPSLHTTGMYPQSSSFNFNSDNSVTVNSVGYRATASYSWVYTDAIDLTDISTITFTVADGGSYSSNTYLTQYAGIMTSRPKETTTNSTFTTSVSTKGSTSSKAYTLDVSSFTGEYRIGICTCGGSNGTTGVTYTSTIYSIEVS